MSRAIAYIMGVLLNILQCGVSAQRNISTDFEIWFAQQYNIYTVLFQRPFLEDISKQTFFFKELRVQSQKRNCLTIQIALIS